MKYIKKFEEIKLTLKDDLGTYFYNLGDMDGFNLEYRPDDFYFFKLSHMDGSFEYNMDIFDEIQESLDRAADDGLKLDRSWIEPNIPEFMSSVACDRKTAIKNKWNSIWIPMSNNEYPSPNDLRFSKFPIYRKIYVDSKNKKMESMVRSNKKMDMDVEYPTSPSDFIYTNNLKSITFLFFEQDLKKSKY